MLQIFYASIHATTLVLSSKDDVVGEIQYAVSGGNETIGEFGRRYDMGYHELILTNPQIDVTRPLAINSGLLIPSQFILPNIPREGIVINLAEFRLYYFPKNENVVITFPVGIGRKGWETPLGITKITAKQVNPKWRPTKKLHAEAEKNGTILPDEFPPNVSNPLGKHALRLGWPTFLIHGTNRHDGIGTRISAGCIRMFPEDIEQLFHLVSVGTQVRIINEPVKIGKLDGSIVLQVYPLLNKQRSKPLKSLLEEQLRNEGNWINNKVIQHELIYPSGLVRRI